MTLDELRTYADKTSDRLCHSVGVAIGLANKYGMENFDLSIHGKLLFQRTDYSSLLRLLKDLSGTEDKLSYSMQWSSGEKVLFSWESESVSVWLVVDPDKVPEELMGPECRIVKTVNQDVQYSLVCER